MRRLFSMLVSVALSYVIPLTTRRLTTDPYAVRFKDFVALGVPGKCLQQLTHEQAKALAEQLIPSQPR